MFNYWIKLSEELRDEVGMQLNYIVENYNNRFLKSLHESYHKYGRLSDKQMKALLNSKEFKTTKSFPPL